MLLNQKSKSFLKKTIGQGTLVNYFENFSGYYSESEEILFQ